MNTVRSRRPITIDEIDANRRADRIGYVLRRYGGLDVYVPRCSSSTGCLHGTQNFCRGSIRPPVGQPTGVEHVGRDPFGKVIPLFGGRIVLGPGKGFFLISLLFFITVLVHVIFEKELLEKFCGGTVVFIIGCCFASVNIFSFLIVGLTDPGVVPKNYSLHELLTETEDFRRRHPAERYYQFCNRCRTCRAPRIFHCSRCEICIRRQEVHLWAAGTCIGERNRRSFSFFLLSHTLLGFYLLLTNFIIVPRVHRKSETFIRDLVQVVTSLVSGAVLFFFPQGGIFMLIYRLYLISVGRTAREEFRRFHCFNTEDCFIDEFPFWVNVKNYFFRRLTPSVFRRYLHRVDPEMVPLDGLPTPWLLEQTLNRRQPHFRANQDLVIPDYVGNDDEADLINANRVINLNESIEAVRLREVANYARGKSTPSVPLFEHGMNPPMTRIRMPRKSKPSSILQQQINAFQKASQMPKATVSNHKRQKLPLCLSDGCIPRTRDGLQEMIQLSRATQLRRIIQMILLRDRDGLVEMASRVNIAALVGMTRFDPDNLQLLELNNGLPMIAPRRREPEAGGHRLGAGVLGIPQMVAAGLLPTARDLANSVETMVGGGRVRRMPPLGRQRYTAITVVGPQDDGRRRLMNIDDDIHINRAVPPPPAQTVPNNNPYIIIPPQIPPAPRTPTFITRRLETPPPPPPSTVTSPANPPMSDMSDDDDRAQLEV